MIKLKTKLLQLQQAAAIKHKTSPARLAQLFQPSLAFCCKMLQPMTAYRGRYAIIDCNWQQNANEGP